jgi:hypothetical protein
MVVSCEHVSTNGEKGSDEEHGQGHNDHAKNPKKASMRAGEYANNRDTNKDSSR